MSFIFASSHLPETRVQRPDELEDEDDDVQPMLHSGGVRAFSHLPAKRAAADPAGQGQLSQRGAQALGRQFQRTEPEGPATPPADGISAAKASGVFDAVRQQLNRDDSPHFMDEDGNLRPRDEARQQDSPAPHDPRSPQFGAGAPPRPAWSAGHAAGADSRRSPRAPSSASEDTRPWYMPPITREDLHPLGLDDEAGSAHSAPKGRPELNDLVYRTHGAPPPKPEFNDLVYRFNGSPEQAKEHARSLLQNVADSHGSTPQLVAAPPQIEGQQPGGSSPQRRDLNKTQQQPATAAPVPGAANVRSQKPGESGADPLTKLKEKIAKSGNPLFIKDYYDEKTPLEEKLLLKQLLLSLKAPEGEKLPLPIANLQHWLNVENRPAAENEGPLEIPFDDLAKFGVMKDGGQKILEYFGSHPDKQMLEQKNMFDWLRSRQGATDGGIAVPDTHWDTQISGRAPGIAGYFGYARPGNEEFYYGLGDATLTGHSSGTKGFVDKNNTAKTQGHIAYTLKDRYDWNKNQGVTIPITMEMIKKYLPKGVPLITPQGKSIQIKALR